MRIAEVPTTLSKDGRSHSPHLRPWRDGWSTSRFMLLFSPRWLFFIPGFVTFLISLLAYVTLLSGPTQIGSIVFDIHTLFYVQAGMILGFLGMMQGITIRMLGMREGLLQDHFLIDRLRDSPVLEVGSVLGLAMIFGGLYWGVGSLNAWSASDFGSLTHGILLRKVSFSTTMIVLGGITLLSSLIMGFLALPTREQRFVP